MEANRNIQQQSNSYVPQKRNQDPKVDQSFWNRAVNYMNRPPMDDKFGKRPSEAPSHNRKMQKKTFI